MNDAIEDHPEIEAEQTEPSQQPVEGLDFS